MQIGEYVQIIKGANPEDPRYVDKQGKITRITYEVAIDPRSGDEGTVIAEEVRVVEEPKEGGENMSEDQVTPVEGEVPAEQPAASETPVENPSTPEGEEGQAQE